jgi:two-component system, chemotaxis family, chemotaxis protein CheY
MGRILLVDDAAYMRRLVGIMVKKGGHEIVGESESGSLAIDLYSQVKPDLVILDILMPDMNGIEVLKRLREIDTDARVLMCTASEQSFHVQEAMKLGAAGYIVKPFNQEQLLEKIQTALQS